ncbi:MAG: glycerate kinase [Actinobacteria bacterium]|nr:glycerate kinase [Actinomycetota bacterium]
MVAPDKFKGSLTAVEAARAMADGVTDAEPRAEVVVCPMADGGEGTVTAIASATGAQVREEEVSGPLPGQEVTARWAFLPPGALKNPLLQAEKTAVIEMAQASGLWLVPTDKRDPFVTTTLGTGQLIRAAIDAGCRRVIVGIGGSATVDGGTGMASALGYRFLGEDGREVPPGGGSLERIGSIDSSGRDPGLSGTELLVACDVDNPLVGDEGAAAVYGPQKGATPEQVAALERGLRRLGELIEAQLGVEVLKAPGAGAAGGLGAGLVAFCGARITSGVELVAEVVGLREKIIGADLVLTGEGSFDAQSARGKAPAGVARIAREMGVPAVILAGQLVGDAGADLGPGVAAFPVAHGPMDLDTAMREAAGLVRSGTSRLVRLLALRS